MVETNINYPLAIPGGAVTGAAPVAVVAAIVGGGGIDEDSIRRTSETESRAFTLLW